MTLLPLYHSFRISRLSCTSIFQLFRKFRQTPKQINMIITLCWVQASGIIQEETPKSYSKQRNLMEHHLAGTLSVNVTLHSVYTNMYKFTIIKGAPHILVTPCHRFITAACIIVIRRMSKVWLSSSLGTQGHKRDIGSFL